MHNYFNTPSSFGFMTQSTSNADPISARSNISHLSGIHLSNNNLLNQSEQLVEDYQREDQGDGDYCQGDVQNGDTYRVEDIYLGLTNIKKNKTMIIISSIWDAKQTYFKMLAFSRIHRSAKYSKESKYSEILAKIHPLLKHYSQQRPKLLKKQALEKLKHKMKQQRAKELKLLNIFGNFVNRKYDSLRDILKVWRHQSERETVALNMKYQGESRYSILENEFPVTPLNKFLITRVKLGYKILKIVISKKIYSVFSQLRHCKSKSKSTGPEAFKKSTSASKFKNLTYGLIVPSSSLTYNKNRMTKMTNKIAEYKIQQRKHTKEIFNLISVIKNMVRKRGRIFIEALKESSLQSTHIQLEKDDNEITTNILKHVCWLSSREALKSQIKNKTMSEELNKRKIRALILALKRKQRNLMKSSLSKLRQHTLNERMQIMKRVKQLQNLKQMYIENYK